MSKRYCLRGHDTFVVGRKKRRCKTCWRATTSSGWQNPKNAIRNMKARLESRIEKKRKQIAELERELGIAS